MCRSVKRYHLLHRRENFYMRRLVLRRASVPYMVARARSAISGDPAQAIILKCD
jgi:hypothetical protein